MLKDGYLYKKVLISSLVFWGLRPSKEELLKFEPNKKDDSDCQEWLTQLYGEQEEKRIIKSGEGGLNGLGSSTYGFEVHDLVLFKYVHGLCCCIRDSYQFGILGSVCFDVFVLHQTPQLKVFTSKQMEP